MNEITTSVGTNGWVSATGPLGKELLIMYTLASIYGAAVLDPAACEYFEEGLEVTIAWLNPQAVTAL